MGKDFQFGVCERGRMCFWNRLGKCANRLFYPLEGKCWLASINGGRALNESQQNGAVSKERCLSMSGWSSGKNSIHVNFQPGVLRLGLLSLCLSSLTLCLLRRYRDPRTCAIFHCSPRPEVEQPGLEQAPTWDTTGTPGGGLTHYATALHPCNRPPPRFYFQTQQWPCRCRILVFVLLLVHIHIKMSFLLCVFTSILKNIQGKWN